MAGLVGSGRTEIVRAVIGADPLLSGRIELNGRPVRITTPRDAVRHGISFISEERRTAVFYGHDIAFNLTSNVLDRFGRLGFFGQGLRMRFAQERADRVGVKAASVGTAVRALSRRQPAEGSARSGARVGSLAADPGRADARRRCAHQGGNVRTYPRPGSRQGLAVWFISSELDEILRLADRIVVVRQGRIVDNIAKGLQAAHVVASALGEKVEDADAFSRRSAEGLPG